MINVYFYSLILTVPLTYLIEKIKFNSIKNRNIISIILFFYTLIILVAISGFRDTATISIFNSRQSDEFNYRNSFNMLIGSQFDFSNVKSYEWLRYLIDWTLTNVSENSQIWVFTYALFTNFFILYTIYKYSKPRWLGLFLYLSCGLFIFQMNGTTSVMAASILMLGIKYALERKTFKYLVIASIASGVHFSAWVSVLVYFFAAFSLSKVRTFILVTVSLIVIFYFNEISNILLPNSPYDYYLNQINSDDKYGVGFFRVSFFLMIYSMIILFSRKNKITLQNTHYFMNNIYVLIFINIVSVSYVYIYRFNELFIISAIILIPQTLYALEQNKKNFFTSLIIILFIVFSSIQTKSILYENILFK